MAMALPEGFTFKIDSDEYTKDFRISVTQPRDTYFAIAFGKGMAPNTDMVRFEGSPDNHPDESNV